MSVDKFVGEVKFLGDFLCEGLDCEGFGCVVAAGVEVELEFLCDVEVVLAEFAGYEGIDVGFEEFVNDGVAAAGGDGYFFRIGCAEFDGGAGVWEELLEFRFEFVSPRGSLGDEADLVALVFEEPVELFEMECFSDECVIANFWVGIEWEVGGVEGEVAVNEYFEFFVVVMGDGNGRGPEEAVVDD